MSKQDVLEIDIYDRQFYKSAAWKKYFEADSIDAELSHPDFENRERMRRNITQKAFNRYVTDLTELASSDWVNNGMPSDNDQWFQLRIARETLDLLFAHFHRLHGEN